MPAFQLHGDELVRGAKFSDDRRYRYSLTRTWDGSLPRFCMVMLNPSKANETRDDPTTTFCMNVARREGFGQYEAVNLFALVGTDPRSLDSVGDPVGRDNDAHIRLAVTNVDRVVIAWGRGGAREVEPHWTRESSVLYLLETLNIELWCFGHNQDGSPRFPRALRRDVPLVRWEAP